MDLLVPLTTVITPNSVEARALCSDADSLEACAQQFMAYGAEYVFITGGHENTSNIVNRLWGHRQFISEYQQTRLPGEFHGTGCTLASAIACSLAQGMSVEAAVGRARDYVTEAIRTAPGYGSGHGPLNHAHTVRP